MSNTSNSSTPYSAYDPTNILLTETQLAERQQRSVKTLQNLRVKGGSIPFVKIGRHVRYRLSDVIAWEAAHTLPVDVGRGGNVMPAKTHRTPSPLSGSQRKLRHEQERMAKLGIPDFETPKDCAKRQEKMIRRMAGTLDEKLLRDLAAMHRERVLSGTVLWSVSFRDATPPAGNNPASLRAFRRGGGEISSQYRAPELGPAPSTSTERAQKLRSNGSDGG